MDKSIHPTAVVLTSTVNLLQTLCLSAAIHAEVMQNDATKTLCGLLRALVESGTTDKTRTREGVWAHGAVCACVCACARARCGCHRGAQARQLFWHMKVPQTGRPNSVYCLRLETRRPRSGCGRAVLSPEARGQAPSRLSQLLVAEASSAWGHIPPVSASSSCGHVSSVSVYCPV